LRSAYLFLALAIIACSSPKPEPTIAAPRATTAAPATTAPPTVAPVTATPAPQTPSPSAIPTVAVRYVAIGASDTVGVGSSDPASGSWPARVAKLLPPGSAYINVGVSGSLVSGARAQQLPGAIAQRPTVVSIWLAVNDLNAGIEPTAYASELGALVDGLIAGTQARVFIGNVPDLRPVPAYAQADKAVLLARINAYNAAIAAIAAKRPGRVIVVDLFTGSAELVGQMTVSPDGFHPSDGGYQLIADRFAAQMKANGIPLR